MNSESWINYTRSADVIILLNEDKISGIMGPGFVDYFAGNLLWFVVEIRHIPGGK